MVAHQRDQVASALKFDQLVQHTLAVDPPIHVVAQRDERVVRLNVDGGENRGEGCGTAVDVADGDGARRHRLPFEREC